MSPVATVGQSFQEAVSRAARVLGMAYPLAALKAANKNADLPEVAGLLYPNDSVADRADAAQLGNDLSNRNLNRFLTQSLSPFLPQGVDPEQVVPIFRGTILEQINLQVKPGSDPAREFSWNHPAQPLESSYLDINQVQGRKQDGVWPDSRVMLGFEDDVTPKEPVAETGFINFDLHTLTRQEHEGGLAERGQKFIHPGKLALPMAARLAESGIDNALNRYDGDYYVVRTEKATTKSPQREKKGAPVWALGSRGFGVRDSSYVGADRSPDVVAGGSPNHKS